LNIYQTDSKEGRDLVFNREFKTFVYSKTVPLIVSEKLTDSDIDDLVDLYKQYDYKLTVISRFKDVDFELTTILPKLQLFYK
jgi:hypothetical protein